MIIRVINPQGINLGNCNEKLSLQRFTKSTMYAHWQEGSPI